jgi:universal stress protein E
MGKILIIADPADRCYATPRGLELARRLGHSAEIIAFTYAPLKGMKLAASEQAAVKKKLLAQRQAQVQKRIDRHQRDGQKVTLKVVWEKHIVNWVNAHCKKPCEMVVKTGHRSEGLTYTSTDWQLLRECPAPVLVVADKKWHKTKPILAALDLGTKVRAKKLLNDQVLTQAKILAEALDSDLKIINALEVPTLLCDLDLVDPAAYAEDMRKDMLPHIQSLAKSHGLQVKDFRCKRGPVAKVITSTAASDRAQLVVMGTVGRKGVKARLLGNTAESVLQHLKTDVLALKP